MKILDRYVLFSFIKNYLISFMVLIGLYVVLDMVFNFDELAEVRGQSAGGIESLLSVAGSVADYYFHQIFLFFVQLSGIIPVVAAAFTLMRLSRFNELTAILAAGGPLFRVSAPIILCGVVLNLILLPINQELVIPTMIPKLTRKHDELQQAGIKTFTVKAMQDDKNNLLNAGRYHPPVEGQAGFMEIIDIIERDEKLEVTGHLTADRADWDAGNNQWKLTGGVRVPLPENRRSEATAVDAWQTSITPDEIALYRSGDFVELLSTERINQLLQRPKSYGTLGLLRVKYFRWAQLLLNITLLLLAIPCVLTREPGTLKRSAVKCVALTGACM